MPSPNAMSKDRVRFKIQSDRILCGSSAAATTRALEEALGIHVACLHEQARNICTLTFICRPSQFARFLILRDHYGGKNGFKELSPELFIPRKVVDPFDATKNPNTYDAPIEEQLP